ncbi:hypothetical protein [Nocardiopsis coralliicola]
MGGGTLRRGAGRGRTPWHLWAAGAAMLLLYAMGARDYAYLLGPDPAYVASQGWGPEAAAYFSGYPVALRAVWTLNIAAGLAAPVLLLLRSRYAPAAALAAAAAQIALMAVSFAVLDRWAALGAFTNSWDIGIAAVTAAFWAYCLRMRRTGVLG